MDSKEHWNNVYETKGPLDVSWHQERPLLSLRLIEEAGVGKEDGIIDVGGGASILAECLLFAGYKNLAVLDLSSAALSHAKLRLGAKASQIRWIEADVTEFVPPRRFGLWHDRAVFHFLTEAADRHKYVENLSRTVARNGHIIIATFASDGPKMCSGLPVMRYDAASISAELGQWNLVRQVSENHQTPWGTEQKFSYFEFHA
jgi:ubiquinone/menaquinone biosynthesis C-methylase UbiE